LYWWTIGAGDGAGVALHLVRATQRRARQSTGHAFTCPAD
jgi:hypothetical protein